MKTQVPAKKPESGVKGRSHLFTSSHKSTGAVSDSSISALENPALHPDGYNFANISVFEKTLENNRRSITHGLTGKLLIQAKLMIGQPNDRCEQEADRVARKVVQQINTSQTVQPDQVETIQSEVTPDRPKEDILQTKLSIQEKPNEGMIATTPSLENSIRQERGNGQTLADSIREPMEQTIGGNFKRVKIHINSQSDKLTRSLNAYAFTTQQDIFFRQGSYAPTTEKGRELLAHELVHVVHQSNGNNTSAEPYIQRYVVNSRGHKAKIADVKGYINKHNLAIEMSDDELNNELENYEEYKIKIGISQFLQAIGAIAPSDEEDNNADPEELKKVKKRTSSAPGAIRKYVYRTHKTNKPYLRRTTSKLGQIFKCQDCGNDLIVDDATGHERGFKTKNSKRGQQPPVCHSDERPADYTIEALDSLMEGLKKDIVSMRSNSIYKKIREESVWEFGREGLYPGHTTCNSKKKDPAWNTLSQTKRKQYKNELKAFLQKQGHWNTLVGL